MELSSVRLSVCLSVRLSVRPGVESFGRRVNIQQR